MGALLLAQTVILGCRQQPAAIVTQAAGDQPKFTISEVMNKAHGRKSNLARKLILGQITDQEKVKLIEYYEALGRAIPPKGSATDWQKRTSNLLAAAKAALHGGPPEKAKFREAVDCKSCHDAHRITED
jgi:hypothetical protein